jgi:alternate signal-mediated exported protein
MKRNNTGKKGLIGVSCLAAAALLIGGVYAYLTYGTYVDNEFSGGNNEIEIKETFQSPEKLVPGVNSYTKKVAVENTGNVPCYVRVFADFSEGDIRAISGLQSGDGPYYSAEFEDMAEDLKDDQGNVVINKESYVKHLPDGWVYLPETDSVEDTTETAMGGWYYYTKPLEAGQRTPDLFDSVLTYFRTEEDIAEYNIIVYSESVQIRDTEGNLMTTESTDAATGTDNTEESWESRWKDYLEGR